eukprot:gene23148-1412_t
MSGWMYVVDARKREILYPIGTKASVSLERQSIIGVTICNFRARQIQVTDQHHLKMAGENASYKDQPGTLYPIGTIPPCQNSQNRMSYSEDNQMILTYGYDTVAKIWAPSDLPNQLIGVLKDGKDPHREQLVGLGMINPIVIASCDAIGTVKLWDIR